MEVYQNLGSELSEEGESGSGYLEKGQEDRRHEAARRMENRRQQAVERLKERMDMDSLWAALVLFAGETYKTAKGLEYTYSIRGHEIFFTRREKSITPSTVSIAFSKVIELDGIVTGPKKLGVFGASYLYPVFIRLGIIKKG